MERSALDSLVGQTVSAADTIHDYCQIVFGGGTILTVFNEFSIEPNGAVFASLVGQRCVSITQALTSIKIDFSNLVSMNIDMSDSGFAGPEALTLDQEGKPPIVWR